MPVKILLADKSITIQKVVEMLFSGRDYEVGCVSDGEAALQGAVRSLPDILLVDIDLPRINGYELAFKLRQTPALAQTPVILMMSRDDVYDPGKGSKAGILDTITKPFESQELIGKVKRAVAAAPPRLADQPAAMAVPAAPAVKTAPAPTPEPVVQKARPAAPPDIFDIIQDAPPAPEPRHAMAAPQPAPPQTLEQDDSIYEIEPDIEEVEAQLADEIVKTIPTASLSPVASRPEPIAITQPMDEPDIVPFESLARELSVEEPIVSMAPASREASSQSPAPAAQQSTMPEAELRKIAEAAIAEQARAIFEKMPLPQPPTIQPVELRAMALSEIGKATKDIVSSLARQIPVITAAEMKSMAEASIAKKVEDAFLDLPPIEAPQIPEGELRTMAAETVERMAADVFRNMPPPPPPTIPDDMVRSAIAGVVESVVRESVREAIERVAWEVVPQLAEQLIVAEIERLKAMP